MFGPKQDPYHTRPDDAQAQEAAYPQDEADQAQKEKTRKWLGTAAEVAADIIGEIVENVFDNIG